MFGEWIVLFFQILLINIVLSGDNAIVIAMASRNLPTHQQRRAVWWGAVGAVGLRLILTAIAVTILQFPLIKTAGAVLLIAIAVKLLADEGKHEQVKEAGTLGKAIVTIIAADFVMSLDNVLAVAAAADGNFKVIIFGIGISIPLIVWGSSLVMKLLHQFPILVYIGAGILGYTAGDMFLSDKAMVRLLPLGSWSPIIPYFLALFVVAVGWVMKQAHREKAA
ncbi:TerC family protein [Gorillibacterium timonense]|uniref:TerC family protein n=1 Tax=Gorillibacterium timonense TaxID=1689269 RepID=UPI00071CD9AF|nr:TerC family protein [Gorillibacterium timonense]